MSIIENAESLINDPETLLEEMTKEVNTLYSDLIKLKNKKNTTAGTRVRKTLMRFKKFAEIGRKVTIMNIKDIKSERKASRSTGSSVPSNDGEVDMSSPDSQNNQEASAPEQTEPVAEKKTKSKSRGRKRRK